MQKVKFFTLGCKVNQYDTQLIREQLIGLGFKEIDNGLAADLCLINTCTVTHRADSESLNLIRRVRRENPSAKIMVAGCLTQLDEDKIRRVEAKSLILKNKDKADIAHFLDFPKKIKQPIAGICGFKGRTRAFLKIQDGCDNFCSYCKVPLVRGRSRSKPLKQIVNEANNLAKQNFKEIVLCGICLGSFGKDLKPQIDLVKVISELEKIDGLLRIRLSSIEAGDVSEELIEKMAQSKKLCRHLHIPVQSGDDEILKRMNRRYSRDDYISLIKKVRSLVPQVAITTDVLVGFPGESESNFLNSVSLTKKILPLKTHIFPYSRREKTLAAQSFYLEIDPQIIKKRISFLKEVASDCTLKVNKQFLGCHFDVLFECGCEKNSRLWQGYTDNYLKVCLSSRNTLQNEVVTVNLNELKNGVFLGII